MELLVRSQDKLLLTKIDYILVNGLDIFNQNQIIGTYKTKERALEVLDEIQNILKPKFKLDTSSIQENGRSLVENGVILQNYTSNADFIQLDT